MDRARLGVALQDLSAPLAASFGLAFVPVSLGLAARGQGRVRPAFVAHLEHAQHLQSALGQRGR